MPRGWIWGRVVTHILIRLNVIIARAWIAAVLIAQGFPVLPASGAAVDPSPPAVQIHPDGSVSIVTHASASVPGRTPEPVSCRYTFGLPQTAPTLRRLEDEKLPIARTQWETNGIRYTQVVLVTRLGSGEFVASETLTEDAVLMVQVVGENTASEYAEATASFSVEAGGRSREIELRDDRVCEVGREAALLLAVVDVPPTGIGSTRGPALRFRGHMPPGTSGAMTVKIPVNPLQGDEALRRLRELDFDEEFRRVKRYWADRVKAGKTNDFPLGFASESVPRPSGGL